MSQLACFFVMECMVISGQDSRYKGVSYLFLGEIKHVKNVRMIRMSADIWDMS